MIPINNFPNNKLNIDIVTSGTNPHIDCILQLTAWPVTPTPLGNKAFTTLIQPYKTISEGLIGTDFEWALSTGNPIYREADNVYNTWLSFKEYLESLYNSAINIQAVNKSIHKNLIFYRFLYDIFCNYYKIVSREVFVTNWPFL